MTKEGKGVRKTEGEDYGIGNFFKILKRKLWKLVDLNVFYILFNFPVIFGILYMARVFSHEVNAPVDPLYPILHGAELAGGINPAFMALWGVSGAGGTIYPDSPVDSVLIKLFFLVILTFGIANAGLAYVLRNYAREEHAYPWLDYVKTIRKNFFQATVLGILDLLFCLVLAYDVIVFYNSANSTVYTIFLFVSVFIAVLYFFMRFYMYILLVTFKLSIFKIIKNSFIFAIYGFKRNIVATLGIILILLINYFILGLIPGAGIVLPFVITVSLCSFVGIYAAWPSVKTVMIDPYYSDKKAESSDAIFTDDVS